MQRGKVALVGAGPGDPELLTIKAAKAIAEADVILVDDLVNRAVLSHAPASARIIHVGKRGGCVSTSQEFIERLMVAEAYAGHFVVRLKGGDSFIFGRGGEEREHLLQSGIEVEVINGISSGLAAPASIGIPLTHRDFSQGVIFVTGHGKAEGTSPDWLQLATLNMTLVIYMGISRIHDIQHGLLHGGKSPDTPVAIIQNATAASQKHVISVLDKMAEAVSLASLGSPGIIVVGEVVHYAHVAFGDPSDSLQLHA